MNQPQERPKKILLFYIYEILRCCSDADHKLSQGEIAQLVRQRFGMSCDRKAVSRNIRALIDGGVDISTYEDNGFGYYLVGRRLSDTEIGLLIDSVADSGRLPVGYVRELIARLSDMASEYFEPRRAVLYRESGYTSNREVPVNLEILDAAIRNKRCVRFTVNRYGADLQLCPVTETEISPYAVFTYEGAYYVAGYAMQKDVSRYWRVDRLTAVHTTATPYIATCDLPQGDPFHNAGAQAVAEGIEGAPIKATLCIPVSLLADTVDAFGHNLHVLGETDEQPSKAVQVRIYAPEKRLRDWVLQQGGAVSVLYPRSLRCAVREMAETIIAQYRE